MKKKMCTHSDSLKKYQERKKIKQQDNLVSDEEKSKMDIKKYVK